MSSLNKPSSQSKPSSPSKPVSPTKAPHSPKNSSTGNPPLKSKTKPFRIYQQTTSATPSSLPFKYCTREVAALSFLTSIPLSNEEQIILKQHTISAPVRNSSAAISQFLSDTNLADSNVAPPALQLPSSIMKPGVKPAAPSSPDGPTPTAAKPSKWWEKIFSAAPNPNKNSDEMELADLLPPTDTTSHPPPSPDRANDESATPFQQSLNKYLQQTTIQNVPGRRLEGIPTPPPTSIPPKLRSMKIIPPASTKNPKAAPTHAKPHTHGVLMKQWEKKIMYASTEASTPSSSSSSLLDNRVFFASKLSYPCAVFSTIKYEPKKEEAMRRRRKVLEGGGGGRLYFATEGRDWRGTSYRAIVGSLKMRLQAERIAAKLLQPSKKRRRRKKKQQNNSDSDESRKSSDSSSSSSSGYSSDSSVEYVPGFIDDPAIVHGRHRQTLMGDRALGPILSSTIQFVRPQALKSELNKQFRERFDQWEPPKLKWKYIGAKAVAGVYTLFDPTIAADQQENDDADFGSSRPSRKPSTIYDNTLEDTIRMPPSLTLSKIRAVKRQSLLGCLEAGCEVGTVALACVFFERLCLDCRVDKRNRKLSMGACLLLSYKFNEPNIGIDDTNNDIVPETPTKLNKKSDAVFAALLEFLAHEWSLGPKELFSAEWGVFVALEFKLHATPKQVAFHFKRLMKNLERRPLTYLGPVMYEQWCECLDAESRQRERRKKRRERKREQKDQKLIELQLHAIQDGERDDKSDEGESTEGGGGGDGRRERWVSSDKDSGFESGRVSVGKNMGLWGRILKKSTSKLSLDRAAEESGSSGDASPVASPLASPLASPTNNTERREGDVVISIAEEMGGAEEEGGGEEGRLAGEGEEAV